MANRVLDIVVKLTDKITGPAKRVADSFRKIGAGARDGLDKTDKQLKKTTKSVKILNNATAKLSGAFTGLFSAATIAFLVRVNTSFQKLRASLVTVTGSAEQASEELTKIREFAATTPFSVAQLTQAFVKLKAFGLDPSIESLESYGNTASAMGKEISQFIEAVADASTNEFERLKEFGIKASQDANTVAFTFQGVTTRIKKNSEDIQEYLQNIGKVQFAGQMTQQMDTIGGAASNLTDTLQNLAIEIGEAGFSGAVQGLYKEIATLLKDATEGVKNNAATIKEVMDLLLTSFVVVANGIKVAFNAAEVASDKLTEKLLAGQAAIARGMAAVTFGDVSKEYEETARKLTEESEKAKQSAVSNTLDIAVAWARLSEAMKEETEKISDTDRQAAEQAGQLKEAYERLGLQQFDVEAKLNTEQLQQRMQELKSEPIIIPVRFEPVNNANDILYKEMVERGDNG